MSKRFDRLAARRAELVAQSDQNRDALAASFSAVEHRLSWVERIVDAARRVHRYRGIVAAVAVGLAFVGRKSRPRLKRAIQSCRSPSSCFVHFVRAAQAILHKAE